MVGNIGGGEQQPSSSSFSSNPPSNPTSPTHGGNSSSNGIDRVQRRILSLATASICHTTGFDSIQSSASEILSSMAHKYLNEICRNSRLNCEHTGRSIVIPSDVFISILNSGINLSDFSEFFKSIRHYSPHQFQLKCQSPVKSLPVLRIAEPRPHPSYFPNFLPPFPDPHTYIRTEMKDDIDSNYEKVRRMNAQNRRDIENSLIGYAISVYPSACVFQELAKRLQLEARDVLNELERERIKKEENWTTNASNDEGGRNGIDLLVNGNGGREEEEEEIVVGPITRSGRRNSIRWTSTLATTMKQNGKAMRGAKEDGNIAFAATSQSQEQQLLAFTEEQLRPKETERSYVLKKIPPFFHILFPFDEPRPYISALVTDDVDLEEEHNYFAQILSKEMEEDMADNDEEEQMEIGVE